MKIEAEYALQAIVELYAILCNTIEDSAKSTQKNKIPINSALYDYINNYLIYAVPFVLLKKEIKDKDQLIHDCYLISKNIIENSDIPQIKKIGLLKPLKESDIYSFTSKVFKINHLNPYISFLNSTISIKEQESEKALVLKDILRPIALFLITGFPLKKNDKDGMKKNISNLEIYLEYQILTLFDMFFNIQLQENNATKEKPEQYASRILRSIFTFMEKNNYPEDAIKYSCNLLDRIYEILFENTKRNSKINTVFNTINEYNSLYFKIDNTEHIQHKDNRSKQEVKNVTRTKRKKASTAVPRK